MTVVSINGFELKEETVLAIGKFAVLWNILEREKCENHCTASKIENLTLNPSDEWKQLAEVLQRRQEQFNLTEGQYIARKLRQQGLTPERVKKIKDFLQSGGETNIVGGLFAIYRIRNNMFHGLKEWQMLDSQTELFNAVNKALERILRGNQ